MAQKIKFNESKPDWKLELVLDDGLIINADGYESLMNYPKEDMIIMPDIQIVIGLKYVV